MSALRLAGVDLGGTNIRAAIATTATEYEHHVAHRTPSAEGPDAVCDAIAAAVQESAGGDALGGVAIGVPGPLNPRTGIVYTAPHLTGWKDIPLVDMMEQRLGCSVAIHNDANLAGYGEWVAGAGMGSTSMVFITVSTGVGGTIIVNGEPLMGASGTAGELGHTPVGGDDPPCAQGHVGCLEGSTSGTAIARIAREAVKRGDRTSLLKVDPETITAETVELAARQGDKLSAGIYAKAGRTLGRMIGGVVNVLNPSLIVIGGGLIEARDLLFPPMHEGIREIAFDVPFSDTKIEVASLGTDAGMVGAIAWAVHEFGVRDGVSDDAADGKS